MLISRAAGTPHFFGSRRGIPEAFTEELMQEGRCFLAARKGQIPLHREGVLGQLQQGHLQHQSIAWVYPLKKGVCWIFSSGFSQVTFWAFSWPVLMPRGYSSVCCSTTEQKDKIYMKKLQSNQEEFPGVQRNSESAWPGDKQKFLWISLLPPCWRVLIHQGSWWDRLDG